jgi:hypothetical protein
MVCHLLLGLSHPLLAAAEVAHITHLHCQAVMVDLVALAVVVDILLHLEVVEPLVKALQEVHP